MKNLMDMMTNYTTGDKCEGNGKAANRDTSAGQNMMGMERGQN